MEAFLAVPGMDSKEGYRMSFSWNVAKYAKGTPSGKTGFFVDGFMRTTQRLFDTLDEVAKNKVREFKRICFEVLRRVKERTAVDTGNAKASWVLTFTEDTPTRVKASITNGVTYVIYLEYGTYKMSAQPMLRISLSEIADEMRRSVADARRVA